jgi:membrane associated rhomboid family serine protease
MTPWVTRLIIANIAVYALSQYRPLMVDALAYVPTLVLERPWTLLTYMFLHGSLGHIIFNMLSLFFFGPRVEMYLGAKRFLWLYIVSGLTAALVSSVFSPRIPIIGASGGVYGVFLGFAFFWPREEIRIWGVLPIEARWMVVMMTGFSVLGGLGVSSGNVAHFAHLGGFIGAYAYLRWMIAQQRKLASRPAPGIQVSKTDLERWNAIDREVLHEVNRDELDRILSKLQREGDRSLTPAERAFLDRFSSR